MSNKMKLILAGVGILVVLVATFMFLIRPRRAEIAEIRAQVAAEQATTQSLESELDRLEELQKRAPQLQATIDRFRELVPENDQVPNFIFQVQEAADEAGVGFVQITPELPKQPPEGAPLAEVRATISAKGGFFSLEDFVRRLYELDRAVRLDNMNITAEDVEGELEITLEGSARIFFELPEGAAAAPGGTPTTTAGQPSTTTTTTAPAAPSENPVN